MSKKKRKYYYNPKHENIRSKILEEQRMKLVHTSEKKNKETLIIIFLFIAFIFLMEN